MPLFRNKFQPKKSPARKATTVSNLRRNLDAMQLEKEFGIQVDTIKLHLDGNQQQLEFNRENGKWKLCAEQDVMKSKSPSLRLRKSEEDKTRENFLKVQVEVLLDMVSIKVHNFCKLTRNKKL